MSKANDTQIGGDHYKHQAFQHWDYSVQMNMNGLQHTATKYVDRWKRKTGVEDLRKATHLVAKYIEVYGHPALPACGPENPRTIFLAYVYGNRFDFHQSRIIELISFAPILGKSALHEAMRLLEEYIVYAEAHPPITTAEEADCHRATCSGSCGTCGQAADKD